MGAGGGWSLARAIDGVTVRTVEPVIGRSLDVPGSVTAVHDAWIGRFASEEAFYAIARLKHGRFRFHEGRPPRPKRRPGLAARSA